MTQSRASYNDLNENGLLDLDIYFDFTCPYSYQVAKWVTQVQEVMGPEIMAVRWHFLSLAQLNNRKEKPGWNIWDQKPEGGPRSLLAFLAGGAAENLGGQEALCKFYGALGRLVHEEGKPIREPQTIEQAWQEAGLDAAALKKVFDGSDRSGLEKLKQDHTTAVERYKAFGTPVLVFEEHHSFFFKLMPRPTDLIEALELFQHIQALAMSFDRGVLEYKRLVSEEEQTRLDELSKQPRDHVEK